MCESARRHRDRAVPADSGQFSHEKRALLGQPSVPDVAPGVVPAGAGAGAAGPAGRQDGQHRRHGARPLPLITNGHNRHNILSPRPAPSPLASRGLPPARRLPSSPPPRCPPTAVVGVFGAVSMATAPATSDAAHLFSVARTIQLSIEAP
jgi:hypothetical protein